MKQGLTDYVLEVDADSETLKETNPLFLMALEAYPKPEFHENMESAAACAKEA